MRFDPVKPSPEPCNDADCLALEALLTERLLEFNARATGYTDARPLGLRTRGESGELLAGCSGYTWGGCCVITYVWVGEGHRGCGHGAALLRAAECEAARRGCGQVVVATHDFQAPGFYERMGYERKAIIHGMPKGHADIIYAKPLAA